MLKILVVGAFVQTAIHVGTHALPVPRPQVVKTYDAEKMGVTSSPHFVIPVSFVCLTIMRPEHTAVAIFSALLEHSLYKKLNISDGTEKPAIIRA